MRMPILHVFRQAFVKKVRGLDFKGLGLMYAVNLTYDEITSDTTLTWKHHVVGINSPGASVTVTLPEVDSAEKGRHIIIKDVGLNAAVHPHTILAPAGVSIDGNMSASLSLNGTSITLVYDGDGNWWIV